MPSGEATPANFIIIDSTRPLLELTIYRTRDEHASHYATDEKCDYQMCVISRKLKDRQYNDKIKKTKIINDVM